MKKLSSFAILILLFIALPFGCKMYERVTLSTNDFFNNEKLKKDFKDYNIYVHDKSNTYKLIYPKFGDSTLQGTPQLVVLPEEIKLIKEAESRKEKKEHKLDINIYSDKVLLEPTANLNGNNIESLQEIEIKHSSIEKVEVYASDDKSTFALIAIVALIVIGAVVITYLIVQGLKNTSDGSAGSTDSNSGGSDSGSGDSGGSNSGGSNSDSGGSGTSGSGGSGCYIATMVYGSYDASEVMILRKFRDEVLSNTSAGRKFIEIYYKYSPRFVKRFENSGTINKNIKFILDHFVHFLSNK